MDKENNSSKVMDSELAHRKKPRQHGPLGAVQHFFSGFADNVDISGLAVATSSKANWGRRIFWTILLLFGACFALYQIISQILLFLTYPVNVYVNIENVESLHFPTLTLCNYNTWKYSELQKLAGSNTQVEGQNLDRLAQMYLDQDSSKDLHSFYLEYSLLKQDMILECTYDSQPCSIANFTFRFTELGLCFSFNTGRRGIFHHGSTENPDDELVVEGAGLNRGLHLVLRLRTEEYPINATWVGLKLRLHQRHDPPMVYSKGSSISPGHVAHIGMSKTKVLNLPDPWEHCDSLKLPGYTGYSSAACRQECKRRYVVDKCGCHELYMASAGHPLCQPSQRRCIQEAEETYDLTDPKCSLTCPVPCKEEFFSTFISYADLSKHYLQTLVDRYGQDLEYWRENIVHINIYYEDMVEEVVTHQPAYTILSMLCDCGGAFGLVLGANCASVTQIFDFIIRRFVKLFC